MATRIEKIFRSKTICLMDSIMNDINTIVQSEKRTTAKEHAIVYKNIVKSICGFYDKHGITDEEIRKAVSR